MTSNRALDEVGELFGDPLLASAAMDRLLDNAHRITTFGDSFRNPPQVLRWRETRGCWFTIVRLRHGPL